MHAPEAWPAGPLCRADRTRIPGACAAPWPCGSARVTLLREYASDRVALLVYLGGLLHDTGRA